MHWDHEPLISFALSNHRPIILPLPAGEGRGEGESFEQECAVPGKRIQKIDVSVVFLGKTFDMTCQSPI
jgi:hypothetical protein